MIEIKLRSANHFSISWLCQSIQSCDGLSDRIAKAQLEPGETERHMLRQLAAVFRSKTLCQRVTKFEADPVLHPLQHTMTYDRAAHQIQLGRLDECEGTRC